MLVKKHGIVFLLKSCLTSHECSYLTNLGLSWPQPLLFTKKFFQAMDFSSGRLVPGQFCWRIAAVYWSLSLYMLLCQEVIMRVSRDLLSNGAVSSCLFRVEYLGCRMTDFKHIMFFHRQTSGHAALVENVLFHPASPSPVCLIFIPDR